MSLNRANFSYQCAKQSGKGITASAPAYFLDTIGGNITGKRTTESLLVGDGNVFSTGFEWINQVEAGGQIDVLGQPLSAPLLCHAVLGTDNVSGTEDPVTHVLTPNNTAGSTSYYTFWKQVDTLWELYPDCKVTEVTISGSVDKKALQISASVLGAAKPQNITAPSDATEETTAYNWNHAYSHWCVDGTMSHICTASRAVDLTTALVTANALKASINTHMGDHATAPHGKANDTSNTIAAASATDQTSLNTLVNEIKTDLNTHEASTTYHYFADTSHTISSATATDLATSLVLLNEELSDYNAHAGRAGCIREFSIKMTRGYSPWYGEDVIPCDLVEGRGEVTASFTMLLSDLLLYNRIMYGTPNPTTGTELSSLLVTGSFEVKFDMGTTPARSFQIDIPEITYTADDIAANVTGDTGGAAAGLTINGRATGTAPIITLTSVCGQVASF